ncbi:MAG: TraV family lipoprotein [Helicobacteraceae bacterium]|jgi:hypothetical protein|nr:TraV family lipoprotein [Helicobacteraceae bacterium]
MIKRHLIAIPKAFTIITFAFFSALAFNGCASKTIVEIDERDIGDTLLKVDPEFAVDNQSSALRANYGADTRVPMRTQPKSAELIIAPHTTKDGVYHGYSAVWIVIEEGDWALGRFDNGSVPANARGRVVITPLK